MRRRFVGAVSPSGATASSHREAPLIGDDPAADNTDLYAFVSPDKPDTVTIIANFIPFEDPAGGPNYYRFDPTVLYEIHVDNDGDARDDVTYRFWFRTNVANPNTFLYNTNQITSPTDPDLSVRQTFSVRRVTSSGSTVLGSNLPVMHANIGPRSNPSYDTSQGVADLGGNRKVFAGPRDDPFFVDLGSIFDLGGLRPFNPFHIIPSDGRGRGGRCPQLQHAHDRDPGAEDGPPQGACGERDDRDLRQREPAEDPGAAGRRRRRLGRSRVQVSRLGNPLINEVIIPLGKKDYWNASDPKNDANSFSTTEP